MSALIPEHRDRAVVEVPCPESFTALAEVLGIGPNVIVVRGDDGSSWWMEADGLGYDINMRAGEWIRDRLGADSGWYFGPVLYLSPDETQQPWVAAYLSPPVTPVRKRKGVVTHTTVAGRTLIPLDGNIVPALDELRRDCGVIWDKQAKKWMCPVAKLQQARATLARHGHLPTPAPDQAR